MNGEKREEIEETQLYTYSNSVTGEKREEIEETQLYTYSNFFQECDEFANPYEDDIPPCYYEDDEDTVDDDDTEEENDDAASQQLSVTLQQQQQQQQTNLAHLSSLLQKQSDVHDQQQNIEISKGAKTSLTKSKSDELSKSKTKNISSTVSPTSRVLLLIMYIGLLLKQGR